jgi:alanine-glyoxylate transaminase/serine-glyoxylate transaminase/serine-pyruvate transaminase
MAGRHFLHVPGPTNVPERIQRAMMRPMEDHRGAGFPALSTSILADLKQVFRTESARVLVFPSSGTGAWEASLLNTLAPGDRVLTSRFGAFSHLWADMCRRLGLDVTVLDAAWGTGAPVERYAEVLKADTEKRIRAVLVCHNETATGVTSDVAGVRRALDDADHPALLYVDGVSSIASIDFQMDAWGVDLAVTGSQKGLMLPPGLGIVAVSRKALAARERAGLRRCYFDFDDMLRSNADGWFPYTPATGLLYGLREALDMLAEEGLDNVSARHHRLAEGVRRGVKAWGLSLCARDKGRASDTVSAIVVPGGHDAAKVIDIAYHRYNLALGAGLMQLAGKVFRIGHLGDLNELMCLAALSGAEMAMRDAGIPVVLGSGVAAAQAYYTDDDGEAVVERPRQVA